MKGLIQDARYAVRSLRHSPGFTVAVVTVLALGIGANTAIFSVVSPFLFRSLPYTEPDRLVHMFETYPQLDGVGWDMQRQSLPTIRDWQSQARSFESIGAYYYDNAALRVGDGAPRRFDVGLVTANLFPLLGVDPAIGRHFAIDEDVPGAANVLLVADSVWRETLGADPNVVGRSVVLDGAEHVIVGVMPPGFNFPFGAVRMWKPAAFDPASWDRESRGILTVGRLQAGVGIDAATTELMQLQERLEEAHPGVYDGYGVRVLPIREALIFFYDIFRGLMLTLLAAVAFVLLIVCANVANLMLARSGHRQREVAIRAAIGAGQSRIARQLLTESLLLAGTAAIPGSWLASLTTGAFSAFLPAELYRVGDVGVDGSALLYTAVVTLATAVVFGLVPVRRAANTELTSALKACAGDGGAQASRFGSSLVFVQITLATVLCGGAVLAAQAFGEMRRVDLGLDPTRVLTLEVALPSGDYSSADTRVVFFDELVARTSALPAVDAAGLINMLPMNFESSSVAYALPGEALELAGKGESRAKRFAGSTIVSPAYFEAMDISLRAGRSFDTRDRGDSAPAVVMNGMLARRLWPDGETDAVGRTLMLDGSEGPYAATVVGVVEDSVGGLMLNGPEPQIFFPLASRIPRRVFLAVRTSGQPAAIAGSVRGVLASLDPNLVIDNVRPMTDVTAAATQPVQVASLILAAFGGFALLLAAIGVYGVVALAINQRTRELGVRMALGARAGQVVALVVRRGATLAASGALIGALLTFALAAMLASFAGDSPSLAAPLIVIAILVAVALLACWLPARRATRIDPVVALRSD